MSTTPLLLASGSPRRRQLLQDIGLRFDVVSTNVDETPVVGETPESYAMRVARAKASAVIAADEAVVLAADTIVVMAGEIFGKPRDHAHFRSMMARLSDATHEVMTAVVVRTDELFHAELVRTRVTFRKLGERETDWYWFTGEPRDKAGGYGIQGIGGAFVTRIEGSHSNVIGLPMVETLALLERAGAAMPWTRR